MVTTAVVLDTSPRSRRALVRCFTQAGWLTFAALDAAALERVMDEVTVDVVVVRFEPSTPSNAIAALVRARHRAPGVLRVLVLGPAYEQPDRVRRPLA